MAASLSLRAGLVSLALLLAFLLAWQIAVSGTTKTEAMDPEYAALMGASATSGCNWRAKADSAAPKPLLPSMRRAAWAAGSGSQRSTQAVGSSSESVLQVSPKWNS